MADAAFLACFGPEDEKMEDDTPTNNLKRLPAAKGKEKIASTGAGRSKRPRDKDISSTSSSLCSPASPTHVAVPSQTVHRNL